MMKTHLQDRAEHCGSPSVEFLQPGEKMLNKDVFIIYIYYSCLKVNFQNENEAKNKATYKKETNGLAFTLFKFKIALYVIMLYF